MTRSLKHLRCMFEYFVLFLVSYACNVSSISGMRCCSRGLRFLGSCDTFSCMVLVFNLMHFSMPNDQRYICGIVGFLSRICACVYLHLLLYNALHLYNMYTATQAQPEQARVHSCDRTRIHTSVSG